MYVVLGLGTFGFYLARSLNEAGADVLAVDRDKEKVKNADKFCTKAVTADVTDPEVLKSLGVREASAVIVSLGEDMAASILTTLHLKDLGVKRIIVKAISEEHERILKILGAEQIVFPERDTAIKVSQQLLSPNLLDALPLSDNYSVWEVAPQKKWIGKSLGELQFRSRYRVQVLAVKDSLKDEIYFNPSGEYVIKDSDLLVLLGTVDDLEKIKKD